MILWNDTESTITLTQKSYTTILCFHGNPNSGKTVSLYWYGFLAFSYILSVDQSVNFTPSLSTLHFKYMYMNEREGRNLNILQYQVTVQFQPVGLDWFESCWNKVQDTAEPYVFCLVHIITFSHYTVAADWPWCQKSCDVHDTCIIFFCILDKTKLGSILQNNSV